MRPTALVLLLLLALPACTTRTETTPRADTGPTLPPPASVASQAALTGRVWTSTDSIGMPGVMRVFLGDGTLLMDSCWETYRLTTWHMESDSSVVWQEDGHEIRAQIVESDAASLSLRLDLTDGPRLEHYRVATVPFTCPDMKR